VTSLKLPIQVNDGPDYLPGIDFEPSLHAWRYIFVDLFVDTMRPYMNTVVVALSSSMAALVIGSMAAYALSRLRFRPRLVTILLCFGGMLLLMDAAMLARRLDVPAEKVDGQSVFVFAVLFVILAAAIAAGALFHRRLRRTVNNEDIAFWMISQRILPPVAVVLPIYVLFQQVGLLDTRLALIVTYVAANIPIVVWLMRDFFDSIPLELEEAALVDGCSRYRIFWSIVLPLSKPGLAATFGADHGVERVSLRALPLERERTDPAAHRGGPERHARAAVVVHVGADHHHDRAGLGAGAPAGALHHARAADRGGEGVRIGGENGFT
jgi:multiple sugar transport system permease protein